MTFETLSDDEIFVIINKDDIESACKAFICLCKPELASGYFMHPSTTSGQLTSIQIPVPTGYTVKKGK